MSEITLDTAIGALSVSITSPVNKTLTIKTLSSLPQEVFDRDCPLLFPSPSNWLGQGITTPGNFDNIIAGRLQYEHNLAYILAYAEMGTGRGLSDFYAGMAALRYELTRQMARIDVVAMSITRVATTTFGQMTDPTGKVFYGCGITVTAKEYIP
jgi:hypothetical protein